MRLGSSRSGLRGIQVLIYFPSGRKGAVLGGKLACSPKEFSPAARRDAGPLLYHVQLGLEPSDWKPMRSVGPGVVEIRIHAGGEHRVLYVARFAEAVYVLHAVEKRIRQTRKADIEQAKRNLAEVARHRRR